MDTIKDFKYKLIKNFLTKEEKNILFQYTKIFHKTNTSDFDLGCCDTCDSYRYGDPTIEALMIAKTKKMNEITGLQLLPTYAFWRVYTYGAELTEHVDRPACEVSVTVQLGSDGSKDWPISIEGNSISLEDGDAVVYLGCDLKHKRDMFKGDWQSQCFLHYVDFNGPHAEWEKDKRDFYGVNPNEHVQKNFFIHRMGKFLKDIK